MLQSSLYILIQLCHLIILLFFCYSYCEQNYCLRCNPSDFVVCLYSVDNRTSVEQWVSSLQN
jgi:hypothetical protein